MLKLMFACDNELLYRFIENADADVEDDDIFVLVRYPREDSEAPIRFKSMAIGPANDWYVEHRENDNFHSIDKVIN